MVGKLVGAWAVVMLTSSFALQTASLVSNDIQATTKPAQIKSKTLSIASHNNLLAAEQNLRRDAAEALEQPEAGLKPILQPVSQQLQANGIAQQEQTAEHAKPEIELPLPDLPAVSPPDRADMGIVDLTLPAPPPITVTITVQHSSATEPLAKADSRQDESKTTTGAATILSPTSDSAALIEAVKSALTDDKILAHPRLSKAHQAEIEAFYSARDYKPLWLAAGTSNALAKALQKTLQRADEDGLDPSSYALAPISDQADAMQLAQHDLRLSVAISIYARDAQGGRIDARRLSKLIDPTLTLSTPAQVLKAVSESGNPEQALVSYHPPHEGYRRLKAKLAELRGATATISPVQVPDGPVLRVGMSDPRVVLLREHFGIKSAQDTLHSVSYDEDLARAVASFQRERGLPATGSLTRQTVAALGQSSTSRLEANILANMERWRWLPRDLGDRHIYVNIPEFLVRVVENGRIVHQARSIVGKPETQTPVFSETMDHMVINPSWFVPPSILKKDFLPKLALDPDYAAKKGFQVIRRGNQISVRQPPGERNALGNIKFMFPNRHAVYLHDTPSRHLFGTDRRAYSHGCVRVDQPLRLAEIVMGRDSGWSESRFRAMLGRGEQSIRLKDKLAVHLVYFTTFVDDEGRLQNRDDLYGHNQRVKAALGIER